MDRSAEWATAIDRSCVSLQLPQAEVARIKGELLLRPVRKPSEFTKFAGAVAGGIGELSALIQHHQKGYLSASIYSTKEKDALEAEVSLLVKTCGAQIERLKNSVVSASERRDEAGRPVLRPQAVAHLHGMVLVLAESLQRGAAGFDALRIQRYRQGKADEERRRAGMGAPGGRSGAGGAPPSSSSSRPPGGLFSGSRHDPGHESASGASGSFTGSAQQQAQLAGENRSLVEYLSSTQSSVLGIEKAALEIGQLNQLFSAAVSSQAEAIEVIYRNALDASAYVSAGNVDLGRTIAVNHSSRKYILAILAAATVCLLLFDWLNS